MSTSPQEQAPHVKIILGTMEFGRKDRETEQYDACRDLVDIYVKGGVREVDGVKTYLNVELDTARMYSAGVSEAYVGKIMQSESNVDNALKVATKANPWGSDGLTKSSVARQMAESLKEMNLPSIDLFYLHAPDVRTPIEETLEAVQELYKQGLFKRFGLSNFAAWQVAEIYHICKNKGYVLPSVYQGMYNCLTREIEPELMPCLRKYDIAFYAYNPLAGGILTGRYAYSDKDVFNATPSTTTSSSSSSSSSSGSDEKQPEANRFSQNTWAKVYQERFWRKNLFAAVDRIRAALDKAYGEGVVSLTSASMRWMMHHSLLSGAAGDGLIIGASKRTHLIANLAACAEGPLKEEVVSEINDAWVEAREGSPKYFR